MVAEKNPEIRKAVDTLYKISTDEKARAVYELRMKSWRDQQSALHYAVTKGRAEGIAEGKYEVAQKMKDMGLSTEQILTATGIRI